MSRPAGKVSAVTLSTTVSSSLAVTRRRWLYWTDCQVSSVVRIRNVSRDEQEVMGVLFLSLSLATSCFKSSSSKSDKHLQFVPTNLHCQRMEVSGPHSSGSPPFHHQLLLRSSTPSCYMPIHYHSLPPGVWYDVITFGAPADHHQSFKHGGLKRLLSKHCNTADRCVCGLSVHSHYLLCANVYNLCLD